MNKQIYHRIVYPITKLYSVTINNFPTFNGVLSRLKIRKLLLTVGETLNQNLISYPKIRKLVISATTSLNQELDVSIGIRKLLITAAISFINMLEITINIPKLLITASETLLQILSASLNIKKLVMDADDVSTDFFRLLSYWDVAVSGSTTISTMDTSTLYDIHRGTT